MLNFGHGLELLVVVAGELFNFLIQGNEVDLVLLTNNFAREFSLVVLFADVAGLVVEKAVGVAHPRYAPEEHTEKSYENHTYMVSSPGPFF